MTASEILAALQRMVLATMPEHPDFYEGLQADALEEAKAVLRGAGWTSLLTD